MHPRGEAAGKEPGPAPAAPALQDAPLQRGRLGVQPNYCTAVLPALIVLLIADLLFLSISKKMHGT